MPARCMTHIFFRQVKVDMYHYRYDTCMSKDGNRKAYSHAGT